MSSALDETEKECVALLNTVNLEGYESKLDLRVEGTLEWVLKIPQYKDWISSQDSKILWVTGYVGSGKTTLSMYIVQCISKDLKPEGLVPRFLCDNKIKNQRDGCQILRSLIFQIVSKRRGLWCHVRKACDAGGLHILHQFDALWCILLQIVNNEKRLSITLIIDAIEECEQEIRMVILRHLVTLFTLPKIAIVKFFITSRYDARILTDIQQLLVHLLCLSLNDMVASVAEDVNLVIQYHLKRLVQRGACRPAVRDSLEDMLRAKADATFLWVKLVLPLLQKRRMLLDSDVPKLAYPLPAGLDTLYEDLLDAIPDEDREYASKLL